MAIFLIFFLTFFNSRYEDNYNDIPMLKDTVKRKISVSGGSPSNFAAEEEPWQADIDTPFTVRPTLPIGQATIWPHQTPEATPFTVKPSTLRPVRPTLKPFIHLGKTQDVWQENTTPTPFTVRPTRRGQAFTVRPTKRPVTFNYIHKSPQGAKLAAHDVKLKSPYESSSGFSGDTSYLKVDIFSIVIFLLQRTEDIFFRTIIIDCKMASRASGH